MSKRSLKVVIVVLMVLFVVFEVRAFMNYSELVAINEDLTNTLDNQRANSSITISSWKETYLDLQKDYGNLYSENMELKDKLNEVELPVYSFTQEEVELLAKCVRCEAGDYSSHSQAQRYVCGVILNRVKSGAFPNNISDVIYQESDGIPQFSVAYNGMIDKCVLDNDTLANVYSVIVYGYSLPDDVLYFYDANLDYENWVKTLEVYDTVEGTVFAYGRGK